MTLRKIKTIGFDAIQISAFGPIEPERLAALVAELELDVCITHSPWERMQNDLDSLIAEHQLLHCDTVGLGYMPNEFHGSAEGFSAFLKEMGEIAKQLAAAGLHFAYHNHAFELERFANGRLGLDMLIEDSNEKEFGFILDKPFIHFRNFLYCKYLFRTYCKIIL